jgi:hypothetical protein
LTKTNKIFFFINCLVVLIAGLYVSWNKNSEYKTQMFCAYGSIFVEFEEHGHRWGSMLLDKQGHPIPCNDATTTKADLTSKESI